MGGLQMREVATGKAALLAVSEPLDANPDRLNA